MKWVNVLKRQAWKQCVTILYWSWHFLWCNIIPYTFCIKWFIFTIRPQFLCFCSDSNTVFNMRIFSHAQLVDEEPVFWNSYIEIDYTLLYLLLSSFFRLIYSLGLFWVLCHIFHVDKDAEFLTDLFVSNMWSSICSICNIHLFLDWEQRAFFHDPHYFHNSLS